MDFRFGALPKPKGAYSRKGAGQCVGLEGMACGRCPVVSGELLIQHPIFGNTESDQHRRIRNAEYELPCRRPEGLMLIQRTALHRNLESDREENLDLAALIKAVRAYFRGGLKSQRWPRT